MDDFQEPNNIPAAGNLCSTAADWACFWRGQPTCLIRNDSWIRQITEDVGQRQAPFNLILWILWYVQAQATGCEIHPLQRQLPSPAKNAPVSLLIIPSGDRGADSPSSLSTSSDLISATWLRELVKYTIVGCVPLPWISSPSRLFFPLPHTL